MSLKFKNIINTRLVILTTKDNNPNNMTFHNAIKVLKIHNLFRSNQSHIKFVYVLIFIIYLILLIINTFTLFVTFVCTYNVI